MAKETGCYLESNRTVFSFWPFFLWTVPLATVYTLGYWQREHWCGRGILEAVAVPLVLVSVISYGLLAWRRDNEFAKILCVLSLGFFCREWHFAGTSKGIYVLIVIVASWGVIRRKQIARLIKNTPVEIWLWATLLCYMLSQIVARRLFAERHLGILPMEARYHIPLEETMETMAHLLLAITSLLAWRQFDTEKTVI
jgi:hypothetical protein